MATDNHAARIWPPKHGTPDAPDAQPVDARKPQKMTSNSLAAPGRRSCGG